MKLKRSALILCSVAYSILVIRPYLADFERISSDDIGSEEDEDSKFDALKPIIEALALRRATPVKNIFWLHIEKTGTSLFNTIYLHFCPHILLQRPEATNTSSKALTDRFLTTTFPAAEWCSDKKFYNWPRVGFHHPYVHRNESFISFTMFRDPINRLKSAYSFRGGGGVPHGSRLPKESNITFATFIQEPQVSNSWFHGTLHCLLATAYPSLTRRQSPNICIDSKLPNQNGPRVQMSFNDKRIRAECGPCRVENQ
jgi:hypothetical protein